MDDNHNTEPFWRRPLPPIQHPAVETDPLADLPPETVVTVDEAAPADDPRGISPQAHLADTPANGAAPSRPVSVADAQRALVDSQMRSARATDAQREARGNVALALERFQRATMQTQTPEQLVRAHIESENQLRADRVAGKIPQRGGQRRLGSAVDAFAFHTRASGRGAGGGRAFGRRAFPASMQGRVVPKSE